MQIEVKEIKRVSGRGNLKALANVIIGDILIRDWRVIQQPDKRAYVSVPQSSWQGKDGKPAYRPLVDLPLSLKEEVKQKVLEAYWEFEGQENISVAVKDIPF